MIENCLTRRVEPVSGVCGLRLDYTRCEKLSVAKSPTQYRAGVGRQGPYYVSAWIFVGY